MPQSYKPAMLVQGVWSYNALRFETRQEAAASASDLFMRWTQPTDHAAHESDDPVNYHRWDGRDYSGPITPERKIERDRATASALVAGFATLASVVEERREPAFMVPWTRDVVVATLPTHVQSAIRRVGYLLRTVTLNVAHDKIMVSSMCSDGRRVEVCSAVKGKDVWQNVTECGAWGGLNAFTKSSLDEQPVRKIPAEGCIVVATTARNRKSPWVRVHARAIDALGWVAPESAHLLPARDMAQEGRHVEASDLAHEGLSELPVEALTAQQVCVLTAYATLKSSARRSEIARTCSEVDASIAVDQLVALGYLKRNRAGATTITPDGRNTLRAWMGSTSAVALGV